MKTVPTPPVIEGKPWWADHVSTHMAKPYPLSFSTSTALLFRAYRYDELPWWRRLLVRWLLGYDLGDEYRAWSKATTTEEDLHRAVMVDRDELNEDP